MTPEEIRAEKDRLRSKISTARGKMNAHIAKMKALQEACQHPNAFESSHMGERDRTCPDCGWVS